MKTEAALAKTEISERAHILGRLGHPARLGILRLLLDGAACVNHLCRATGLSQPNASQHLLVLRECGMVDLHVRGSHRCYYLLRPAFVRRLLALLEAPGDPEPRLADEVAAEVKARWGECG